MPPPTVNNSAPAERTECIDAPRGSYIAISKAAGPEPCLPGTVAESTGQSECNPCPHNANCDVGDGDWPRNKAVAAPGHFRMANNGSFVPCRIPDLCLGDETCKEGAADISLGCYPCANGWTRFAGNIRDTRECTKCPSFLEGLIIVSIVFGATGFFSIFLTRINITAARHASCLHPFMLKIALSHLQLMSAFERFQEWELEPGFGKASWVLRQILAVTFAWDGAMPTYLIPLDCMLDEFKMDFKVRMWLQLAFWSVMPFLFVLACLALGSILKISSEGCSCFWTCFTCSWKRESVEALSRVIPSAMTGETSMSARSTTSTAAPPSGSDPYEHRVFGIWRKTTLKKGFKAQARDFFADSEGLTIAALVMTYPSVLQQVMAFVRCDSLTGDDEQARLLFAPSIVCGEGDHTMLLIAAWVVFLSWGLGLPFYCGARLVQQRNRLHEFSIRCRLGLLGAEYEPQYFYWDAFILLRRFAATVAMLIAPGASRALQLAILLALGLVSLFVHVNNEPFDNRCGLLLDVLEAQALKLFCATCCVLLLGFSQIAHYGFCFFLVFVAVVVHVLFILRLIMNMIVQVQRSIFDGVVDAQMLGRSKAIGPWRNMLERIFLLEVDSQAHRSHVYFRLDTKMIELGPGPAGVDVRDFERTFVAEGLAECLFRAISDVKLERLSVNYLDFVTREAFASLRDRLQCTQYQNGKLSAKIHGSDRKQPELDMEQSRRWRKSIRQDQTGSVVNVCDPSTFANGILASEFQLQLINISLLPRDEIDNRFRQFQESLGSKTTFHLMSTRERLQILAKPGQGFRDGILKTAPIGDLKALGDAPSASSPREPSGQVMLALPPPAEDPPPDAQVLEVTELEEPVSLTMKVSPDSPREGTPLSQQKRGSTVVSASGLPMALTSSDPVVSIGEQGAAAADVAALPGAIEAEDAAAPEAGMGNGDPAAATQGDTINPNLGSTLG